MRHADERARTQLDLYVQVPYSALRFDSSPLGFAARYQVSADITVLDAQGRPTLIVESPIWDRSVTVPVFAETESRTARDITTRSVILDPGKYLVALEIIDHNANTIVYREISADVRDLDQPLAVSDLVLLDSYDSETRTVLPRVSNVIGGQSLSFDILFELYTDRSRTVTLTRELVPIHRGITAYVAKPVLADTAMVDIPEGRHQMVSTFPVADLGVGSYRVRIRVQDGNRTDAAECVVFAQWTGLSLHLDDLDKAIDQMVYAASKRELREIREGDSEAERRRLFNEFWKELDPTPQTERNERMEEYYFRVNAANQRFSYGRRPGWQTDRGHVLILHGDPEEMWRQTYSFNAEPYEVWYYYRIGRRYVFVDATGFGDYELLVPVWDERTRIR